ncbi:hypothetical protein CONCODRAFT_8371 [Conidiobolus coronatus NRRL 28638]|uniref:Uncharacterized protein n=1 Tax=Conidiobolus coronatus (strain ATCC 28846 / CBS 209.66 / NRRL 28638) TaxID=796925 RepID=A0A137P2M2_CONC2|nr:hypothetical protein CONCODRAFT_8371 [Conidiobolus coronatus NRRL 28638]|eukprot:KXN69262.1 hypothetical protein CONCODRAFT_8371 [Conidiobolus coronatus NRRL 28638]
MKQAVNWICSIRNNASLLTRYSLCSIPRIQQRYYSLSLLFTQHMQSFSESNPLEKIIKSKNIHYNSLSIKLISKYEELEKILNYTKLPQETSMNYALKVYHENQLNEGILASYILPSSRKEIMPFAKMPGPDSSLYIKDKVIRREKTP